MAKEREEWIDWLRVVACFLVMLTHSCEPFYFGGNGTLILIHSDAAWLSVLNVIPRVCVPLFVVASSYLLFPLHYSAGEFFHKRVKRVLVPFVIWTLVYAFVYGEPIDNLKTLLLNFNYASGHLWFIYMLIGLYIIMPMLSPWAKNVTRKELRVYLAIWLFTTFIPLIRQWVGGEAPIITGPSGIPNMAKYPLWGEASWNAYGTFYYMSGFIGYMLLGLYFRRFVGNLSWKRTLVVSVPMLIIGMAVCACGFLHNVYVSANGTFPVEGSVAMGALWEVAWLNDTIGVALMTIAWMLLFKKITFSGRFYTKILLPVSKASYGMYLCHMFLLSLVVVEVRSLMGIGNNGIYGVWTTPVEIILIATISFVLVALICVCLQRIPKIGKWLIG